MSATSTLLHMEGITRTFQVPDAPPLHILTDVNLTVEPGEHVAIVGRSGTGKSTLLNILGLLDAPTSGRYSINGKDTSSLGEGRRTRLRGQTFGFVFQSFNLISGLSTTENVAAPLMYDTAGGFWGRTARAEELLEHVGLGGRLGSQIGRLSGGEQQRVAIARALARHPSIILADEPTGALDVDTGRTVSDLMERECRERGAALIVITHDPTIAARAHTQYRLGDGVLTPIQGAQPAAPSPHPQAGSLPQRQPDGAPPASPLPAAAPQAYGGNQPDGAAPQPGSIPRRQPDGAPPASPPTAAAPQAYGGNQSGPRTPGPRGRHVLPTHGGTA